MLKRIIYIFLLLISISTFGQRTNSSPYSFFGIGQEYSSQTVEQATMGGIGVSFSSIFHLNFINPAANSKLRFATFSAGLNVNDLKIKDNTGSQSSTSTSLSYINVGFPIGEKAGIAFGLRPNTSVGYSLLNVVNDSNGDPFEATRFFGSGGTNKIYGAYGVSILDEIESRTGRVMNVSAVHAVLKRLENKGYLKSEMGGATQERGGRRKRFFLLTQEGKKVLDHSMSYRIELYKSIPDMIFKYVGS